MPERAPARRQPSPIGHQACLGKAEHDRYIAFARSRRRRQLSGRYRYSFGPGGPRVRFQRPLSDVGVLRLLAQQVQGDVSLRGAARADWRGDSGINQAPTCQVADCGGNRERLGRHRHGGCRGGRSATDRDRHRKPDDYRRNRHDNDAAVGATDGERQPNYESASSQRLLRSNAGAVPPDRAGRPDRLFDANRRELNRADTRLI